MEPPRRLHRGIPQTRPRGVFGAGESRAKPLGGGGRGAEVGVRAGGVAEGDCGKVEMKIDDFSSIFLLYNVSMTATNQIVQKCKEALAKQYGRRLKGVILYGSLARGEATPASDIDLLVLLEPPLDYFAELWNLIEILYPIQLESEQLISAKPVSVGDFELGSLSLYRNARREGVAV